jgi:hypothetical protein
VVVADADQAVDADATASAHAKGDTSGGGNGAIRRKPKGPSRAEA